MTQSKDFILPFQLDRFLIKGRMVSFENLANTILKQHHYPETVSHTLGEMIALVGCLEDMLKYKGVFSIQTQSKGPISRTVTDITSDGCLRSYAHFDQDWLHKIPMTSIKDNPVSHLLGKGYLAFNLDQHNTTDRYQGIVPLEQPTLTECVQEYFTKTENLETLFYVATDKIKFGNQKKWVARALMLRRIPRSTIEDKEHPILIEDPKEGWEYIKSLIGTLSHKEMLNPKLSAEDLLFRLFHELDLRIYPPKQVDFGCRCSETRMNEMIQNFTEEEKKSVTVNDKIEITCLFCSQKYIFNDVTK